MGNKMDERSKNIGLNDYDLYLLSIALGFVITSIIFLMNMWQPQPDKVLPIVNRINTSYTIYGRLPMIWLLIGITGIYIFLLSKLSLSKDKNLYAIFTVVTFAIALFIPSAWLNNDKANIWLLICITLVLSWILYNIILAMVTVYKWVTSEKDEKSKLTKITLIWTIIAAILFSK